MSTAYRRLTADVNNPDYDARRRHGALAKKVWPAGTLLDWEAKKSLGVTTYSIRVMGMIFHGGSETYDELIRSSDVVAPDQLTVTEMIERTGENAYGVLAVLLQQGNITHADIMEACADLDRMSEENYDAALDLLDTIPQE